MKHPNIKVTVTITEHPDAEAAIAAMAEYLLDVADRIREEDEQKERVACSG